MTFQPGQSGNPAGKKIGTKNRKTLLLQELEEDGSALAAAIKVAALAGDASAMSLWLSRLEPPARTRGMHVEFEFDPNATPAENIVRVLTAISAGELTLEAGSTIVSVIGKLASARAATEVPDKESELIAAFKDMATKLPV
jgi:hypothetical protein